MFRRQKRFIEVPAEVKHRYSEVAGAAISGTRNRLIHGCFAVDYDVVWAIVQSDLPALVDQLERKLKSKNDDGFLRPAKAGTEPSHNVLKVGGR